MGKFCCGSVKCKWWIEIICERFLIFEIEGVLNEMYEGKGNFSIWIIWEEFCGISEFVIYRGFFRYYFFVKEWLLLI